MMQFLSDLLQWAPQLVDTISAVYQTYLLFMPVRSLFTIPAWGINKS